MKNFIKVTILLAICLASLFLTKPVQAFPPLPSSFYGTIKVDGTNIPDGTPVEASINGHIYAQGQTQTYQGDSVYSLDIPGDDSTTTDIEGGRDGDLIIFTVGGTQTQQTGVWKGGTNVSLNLILSTLTAQDTSISPLNPTPTENAIQATENLPTTPNLTSTAGVIEETQTTDSSILPTQANSAGSNSLATTMSSGGTIIGIAVVIILVLLVVFWRSIFQKP